MTGISREDVIKVAHLARMAITEDKIGEYAKNLSDIFDLIAKLNEVNTDGIAPLSHPLDATQRFRKDIATEIDQRDLLQRGAPSTEDGLYLVPKVIE